MTTITIKTVDPDVQRTAVFQNAVILALLPATPAQVNAFLTANVTNIATANTVLSALAQAVAYLLNKESGT